MAFCRCQWWQMYNKAWNERNMEGLITSAYIYMSFLLLYPIFKQSFLRTQYSFHQRNELNIAVLKAAAFKNRKKCLRTGVDIAVFYTYIPTPIYMYICTTMYLITLTTQRHYDIWVHFRSASNYTVLHVSLATHQCTPQNTHRHMHGGWSIVRGEHQIKMSCLVPLGRNDLSIFLKVITVENNSSL